jgi:ligand-binding SRPBCC domain-containing protein
MTTDRFVRRTRIAAPAAEVFRWHARQGALERLTPPWESIEVLERTGGIEDGSRGQAGSSALRSCRSNWARAGLLATGNNT